MVPGDKIGKVSRGVGENSNPMLCWLTNPQSLIQVIPWNSPILL